MQTQTKVGQDDIVLQDDIVFCLNAEDQLCFVNDAYDCFAAANATSDVSSPAVLRESIWDSVTDSTTRQIYLKILVRVRAVEPIRFRIRGDSPSHRRSPQIEVSQAGTTLSNSALARSTRQSGRARVCSMPTPCVRANCCASAVGATKYN